jgi:1-phosphofructokinase family hexose kinase
MILCITPNPAVDRTLIVPRLDAGEVHRAQQVIVAAGGKGLNVARTIQILGREPLCMGFAGGHMGRLLAALAQKEGFDSAWTWTKAETRTCTILVAPSGDATVINEPGMPVAPSDWKQFQLDVNKHISAAKLVCLSGSLPPDASTEDLQGLLNTLIVSGKQTWVDTSGRTLSTVLSRPALCIKVNGGEIGEALGFEVNDVASSKRALIELGERGHPAALITLGSAGALLSTPNGRWHAQGPRVSVVSTVGSGDAFLGGLVSALDRGADWSGALCDAVAAGTANTLSAGGGQFKLQEFEAIRAQVQVQSW